jgi:hypothetical protein
MPAVDGVTTVCGGRLFVCRSTHNARKTEQSGTYPHNPLDLLRLRCLLLSFTHASTQIYFFGNADAEKMFELPHG